MKRLSAGAKSDTYIEWFIRLARSRTGTTTHKNIMRNCARKLEEKFQRLVIHPMITQLNFADLSCFFAGMLK